MRLRVAVFAATAVFGALSLAACQRNPEVAAYVGDEQITAAQVQQVVDASPHVKPAPVQQADGSVALPKDFPPPTRSQVLSIMVLDRLCAAEQAKTHFETASVAPEATAASAQVAPSSPFAVQTAKTRSCLNGFLQASGSIKPTEAQARDIYDRAKAANLVQASFGEIKDQIIGDPSIGQAIGAKNSVEELAARPGLTINPRYQPLEYVVSAFEATNTPLVVAAVGPSADAVRAA